MLHLNAVNSASPHGPSPGYRPDLRIGRVVAEVKTDLHSFRNLRAALLQLAYYLSETDDEQGILVLVNPRITEVALRKEWELLERTLRPSVAKRLVLAVRRDSEIHAVAGTLEPRLTKRLLAGVDEEARARPHRAPQSADAILQVLLNEWFQRSGPMTTQWLMQAVGCSYPTAANALRRLGPWIRRLADRRFELRGFPADAWMRLISNRDQAHPTLRYVDRSGQLRAPAALLRRASRLGRDDLAVGGVIAARHYYPDLDLRGTPRLDLTLHSPDGRADLSFVEDIDPALERANGREESATLAVHVLRRQGPFFQNAGEDLPWADPVSTILDLYDAQLEAQAKELLDHFVTSVG